MELNVDQKRIIETEPNGHMLVKGVAGSGKTTVAIYKIPHLLNHYCMDKDDKILIVTYTKTLINYIDYIYQNMDYKTTLFSFLNNEEKVEIKTIDSVIYSLFFKYQRKLNKNYKTITSKDKYRLINYAINKVSQKYAKQNIVKPQNGMFLLEEIDWIKSCKYIDIETYQSIDRKGRANNNDSEGPQRILKNSENRKAIFDLMIFYERLMVHEGLIDFKTMALKVLKAIEQGVIDCPVYTHVLIDESQDLTRVQLEILEKLYNKQKRHSSIVLIADTAQSIYSQSWLSYQTFKSVGFDMSGRARVLSKNYRTTTQIAQSAYSLIENDENITGNENYVKPSVIERQGDYPLYQKFSSDEEELKFICHEIKEKLYKKYDLKEIAIIARTKGQLFNAREYLIKNGIDVEIVDKKNSHFDNDSVKLITMHSIKGLEFKVVMIIGLNADIIPLKPKDHLIDNKDIESVERKLLYVGMTRAKEELYLLASRDPSKFIAEIDPKYLRFVARNIFSKVKHIGIENFEFKDKIIELYSREEIVRQWVINELHEKLGYPYEMMDIEYKVKSFSHTGYVDVVVFNARNRRNMPFIFIEVKRMDEDIDNALDQVKSYMNTTMNVEYGMVTNGEEVKMIRRKDNYFESVNDLPAFKVDMSEPTDEFHYIDFRKGKNYRITRNVEDKDTISLYDENSEIAYDITDYYKLRVYGDIVAGHLKLAVEELSGEFMLPQNLLYDGSNCFMLKVTGDSMINAGIDIGDYVIVHKQNYADNLDMIVAVVGDEATLKKYSVMGDNVLLMPENKNYEPIIVEGKDLIINGKVIGVLKMKELMV